MNEKSTIVRHSLSEIADLRERGEDRTNADAPEAESLGTEFWKSARVVVPQEKPPSAPQEPFDHSSEDENDD